MSLEVKPLQVFLKVFMSAVIRGGMVILAFGSPDGGMEASASGNANEDTACYSQSPHNTRLAGVT